MTAANLPSSSKTSLYCEIQLVSLQKTDENDNSLCSALSSYVSSNQISWVSLQSPCL